MKFKRWNPTDRKNRPSCPHYGKGQCLQNCVHLVVEGAYHGCSLEDKAMATIQIAHAMAGAAASAVESTHRPAGEREEREPGRGVSSRRA